MELISLMKLASTGYPADGLASFYDAETGLYNGEEGDSLATFIVREISGTYYTSGGDAAQLDEAIRVVEQAIADLQGVADALREARSSSRKTT